MDIESYEWSTFPFMLNSNKALLPKQILMELHFFPKTHIEAEYSHFLKSSNGTSYQPPGTPLNMIAPLVNGKLDYFHPSIRFFQSIYVAGYDVAQFEYNSASIEECCQEFTFIRT